MTSSADLFLNFGMRVDRDAAAVVGDGEEAVGLRVDLDRSGVAGHRLVHRIVDDLGEQVVQRLLVGAADIHAGAAAHRLQPLQHLDVGEYFLFCPNGGFYNYRDQHVCALEPLSARCIATNCDSRSYAHKAWRLARQAAAKYLFRLQGAFSDIVYITRFQVDAVGRLHPEGARMHLVSNPISSENLGPKPQPASGEIIYVGRLSPEKGVLLFAEAARRAKLTPIFVGDGPMRAELAAAYPEARIQGWVKPEEARAAMRAARAMVFPSQWWEAQGLTALEAKAFGTPVIVADQCAAREEVEDGVTGLWFRTGDIDHLTAALHKMQDDAAVERMSLAAYQAFWAEPRGLERHVEIIVGVYRDMLARSQRGGRS
jgi:glycosyltransferase involved in cell wall biosynthesis